VYSNVTVLVVGEEGVERCKGKQAAEEKRTAKKTAHTRNMPSTRARSCFQFPRKKVSSTLKACAQGNTRFEGERERRLVLCSGTPT
jgi:hypothetical protein